MTAKVYPFPSQGVIKAVRHLEGRRGPIEADALACSLLLLAIERTDPVPPWTVTLMLSTLLRYVGNPLALGLAQRLARIDDPEIRFLAQGLLRKKEACFRAVGAILARPSITDRAFSLFACGPLK